MHFVSSSHSSRPLHFWLRLFAFLLCSYARSLSLFSCVSIVRLHLLFMFRRIFVVATNSDIGSDINVATSAAQSTAEGDKRRPLLRWFNELAIFITICNQKVKQTLNTTNINIEQHTQYKCTHIMVCTVVQLGILTRKKRELAWIWPFLNVKLETKF